MIGDDDCFTALLKDTRKQLQLFFGLADIRDVDQRSLGLQGCAVLRIQRLAACQDVLDTTIRKQQTMRDLVGSFILQRIGLGLYDHLPIFRVGRFNKSLIRGLDMRRIKVKNTEILV